MPLLVPRATTGTAAAANVRDQAIAAARLRDESVACTELLDGSVAGAVGGVFFRLVSLSFFQLEVRTPVPTKAMTNNRRQPMAAKATYSQNGFVVAFEALPPRPPLEGNR